MEKRVDGGRRVLREEGICDMVEVIVEDGRATSMRCGLEVRWLRLWQRGRYILPLPLISAVPTVLYDCK